MEDESQTAYWEWMDGLPLADVESLNHPWLAWQAGVAWARNQDAARTGCIHAVLCASACVPKKFRREVR